MAPGPDTFFPQGPRLGQQRSRVARRVVGAQHAHHARYASGRKMSQGYRWYAGFEAGFASAAGHMRMTIDKSRNQYGPFQVIFRRTCCGKLVHLVADTKDPATADQDMTNSEVFRCEDSGIGEEF